MKPDSFPKYVRENLESLAKSAGLSQECKRSASNYMRDKAHLHSSSNAFRADMNALFASASVSVKTASDDSYLDTTSRSQSTDQGCSSAVFNMVEQSRVVNDIKCKIKENRESDSVKTVATSSIIIEQVSSEVLKMALENLKKIQTEAMDHMAKLVTNPNVSIERLEFFQNAVDENVARAQKAVDSAKTGGISIKNTKLKTSVKSQITYTKINSKTVVSQVENELVELTKLKAEQALVQQTGVTSLPPNSKTMLVNKVDDDITNMKTDIERSMKDFSMSTDANSVTKIISAKAINIQDVEIDADISLTKTVELMDDACSKLGEKYAQQLLSDYTSKTDQDLKSEGVDTLIKEAMESREKVQLARAKMFTAMGVSIPKRSIFQGVGGLVAVIVLYKVYKEVKEDDTN